MNENVENLILARLDEMRRKSDEFERRLDERLKAVEGELKEVRSMIGGQGVILTSIAGYAHQVEERVEALEDREQ